MVLKLIKTNIARIVIMLFFILGTLNPTFAQSTNHEKVFVHINRDILLNGSYLKYTAYTTNNESSERSKIVYFELVDCDQITILNWKSNTKNQTTSGSIKIPEHIQNGLYYLKAYTHKIRNYPANAIYTHPLIIQRIYEDPNDTLCIDNALLTSDSFAIQKAKTQNNYLTVEIEDNIDLKITLNPKQNVESANLSISITEIAPLNVTENLRNFTAFNHKVEQRLIGKELTYKPTEKNYNIISGQLLKRFDSAPIPVKCIYLAYPDSTIHFSFFKTNSKGEFCFLLDSTFNNKDLFFQLNDMNCQKDSIVWLFDDKQLQNQSLPNLSYIEVSNTQKEYITELQKRELIHRIYNQPKTIKKDTEQSPSIKNFFQNPSTIVKPSDYIELTNFQDICDNILPSVRFRIVDHKVQIGLVINQQIVFNNILICVNGLPCFNMNYIENLSSKDIKRIEVFNSVLLHGELTFNGVIGIYTYKKEIDDRIFCNTEYNLQNTYYSKEETDANTDKTTPTLTPDIYWNPSIIFTPNKPITFNIKKPEIGNSYRININGLINNSIPFGFESEIKIN